MEHSRDQGITSTSSVEPKKQLSGKKVLLVEDKKMLRKFATLLLFNHGAIVDACENGKEAFDIVRKVLRDQKDQGHSEILTYDYILMDCEMPIMNGYEATKLIREEEKLYRIRIPIIALTATYRGAMAEEEEEAINKTKDAEMDFHLVKPLKIDDLMDAIANLF